MSGESAPAQSMGPRDGTSCSMTWNPKPSESFIRSDVLLCKLTWNPKAGLAQREMTPIMLVLLVPCKLCLGEYVKVRDFCVRLKTAARLRTLALLANMFKQPALFLLQHVYRRLFQNLGLRVNLKMLFMCTPSFGPSLKVSAKRRWVQQWLVIAP